MRRVAPAIILGMSFGGFAEAAPILIQPVIVCDNFGSHCAGGDPAAAASTYSTLFDPAVLNKIFAQSAGTDASGTSFAGVTFQILPAHYLSNSSYLTTTIEQAGSPVDQAHQLLRLPNTVASPNPTTLDVYLVDQLAITNLGVPVAGTVHGYGLISSNGAILDTGAHVDSLAHEIGYYLGLTQVDGTAYDSPNNLLQTSGRNVPSSVSDPAIATTIDLLSGVAGNDQIARANTQLFTVNQATAVAGASPQAPGAAYCVVGSLNCGLYIGVGPVTNGQSLMEVKIRWLDPNALRQTTIDTLLPGILYTPVDQIAYECREPAQAIRPLVGGGVELDVFFQSGCLTASRVTSLAFSFPGQADGFSLYYENPFSIEWDFTDGSSSIGLFDATGNAVSPITVAVTAVDHSDVEQDGFVDVEVATAVPEPASAALVVVGLAGLWVRRARRLRPMRLSAMSNG